jgi:hypothetical protein
MLIADIERYLSLRQSLGFNLYEASRRLHSFGQFAMEHGDTHVRTVTAIDWATAAPSPNARRVHLEDVVRLARFLHSEDPVHEIPPDNFFLAIGSQTVGPAITTSARDWIAGDRPQRGCRSMHGRRRVRFAKPVGHGYP